MIAAVTSIHLTVIISMAHAAAQKSVKRLMAKPRSLRMRWTGIAIHSPLDEAAEAAAGLDECQGHTTEADGYHYHAAAVEENAILSCFTGVTVEGTGPGRGPGGGGG